MAIARSPISRNLCMSEPDSLNFVAHRGDLKRRWAPASRVSIAQHVNVPWRRALPRHFGEFTKRVEHFLEHQKIATILMVFRKVRFCTLGERRGRCCVDPPAGSFEEAWMLNRRRLAGLLGATAVGALAAPALITPSFAQVAAPLLQRGNYLVKNGAVITVDAAGVLPRADVHVNSGRIEAVGVDLDVAGADTI